MPTSETNEPTGLSAFGYLVAGIMILTVLFTFAPLALAALIDGLKYLVAVVL